MDITKFPEGPAEIAKYMDYLPDDEKARIQFLMSYVIQCLF